MRPSRASAFALASVLRARTRSTSLVRWALAGVLVGCCSGAARAAPEISTASLPDATAGAAYSATLEATNGTSPYTWTVAEGALPPGLGLDGGTGEISGTSNSAATAGFVARVTDAVGDTASRAFSITVIVPDVPAAANDLAVTRQTTGNDADGTSLMQVTFTPTAFTTSAEVYRAPFGGYPRYDDAGGLVPPTPSYPPGSPWVLTGVTASGQTDNPPNRDAWAYVVFLKNSLGQVSTVSNKTPTHPNYALGDVSDGFVAGSGDNAVDDLDISLLGAHYGISGNALTSAGVHYLDVGPTTDFLVTSRPFTDIRLDFEDLIVCATNYGAVSSPATIVAGADAAARSAKGAEQVNLHAPSLVDVDQVFEVTLDMQAAGRVQGLSVALGWDPNVVAPVTFTSSGWVEAQRGVVWSSAPGVVDAALLGARARGLTGSGTLARLTFRAHRLGDPAIRIAEARARDAANRPVANGAIVYGIQAAAPSRTMLFAPWPNPASGPATVSFALSQRGDAELAIYSVDGRRVRTLASGPFEPGSYHFTWDGDDEQRRDVAPGVYYAQLVTHGRRFSRTIVHLR